MKLGVITKSEWQRNWLDYNPGYQCCFVTLDTQHGAQIV